MSGDRVLQPALLFGDSRSFHPVASAELLDGDRQVIAHRPTREVQLSCHLVDGRTAHAQGEHVAFSRSQRARAFLEGGDGQLAVDHLLARRRLPDGRRQFLGWGVLEQEAGNTTVDRTPQVAGAAEYREDENPAGGELLAQAGRRRDAILTRHLDVQEGDVRVGAQGLLDDGVAALDSSHHLDVLLSSEKRRKRAADHRLVLGDENADHVSRRGTATSSRKPFSPPAERAENVPPTRLTRSSMPFNPVPAPVSAPPMPSSSTTSTARSCSRLRRTTQRVPWLCLRTLVTPSLTAQASTLSCTPGSPSSSSSTDRPIPAARSAARLLASSAPSPG